MRGIFKPKNQRGLASIMVVLILIILITVIGISFTKIMNRALQNSGNSQQAAAADYAARSALNDAIAYIKGNPTVSNPTDCGALLSTTDTTKVNPDLSPTDSSGNAAIKYTCFLVQPTPPTLLYQSVDANKSQVVHLKTAADSIMLSWQATDRQYDKLPASGTDLLDETSWAQAKYEPLMRLTIYPVKNGNLQTASTFFLYPQSGGANVVKISGGSNTVFQTAHCGSGVTIPSTYSEKPDYDCNAIFNNLSSMGDDFYLRLTPIYHASNIEIQADNSSNKPINFNGVQSIVDVTAQGGNSVKRLQARVDTDSGNGDVNSSADSLPEVGLRSAEAICKRLVVNGTDVVTDPSSLSYCTAFGNSVISPTLSFSASPTSVTSGGSSTLSWSQTGGSFKYDSCTGSGGSWGSNKSLTIKTDGTATTSTVTNITASNNTYSLTCKSSANNLSQTQSVTVAISSGPDFTINVNPSSGDIKKGTYGVATITATAINGFSSNISLSSPNIPAKAKATITFTPALITTTTSSAMKIKIACGATKGTYILTVTGTALTGPGPGTSGTPGTSHSTTLTINVLSNSQACGGGSSSSSDSSSDTTSNSGSFGGCDYCPGCSQCSSGGGGGGGCFIGGTMIAVPGDTQKPIEAIKVGDKVLTWDFERSKMITTTVSAITPGGEGWRYTLLVATSYGMVTTTPNHLFFTDGKYIPAGQLKAGDKIADINGRIGKVLFTMSGPKQLVYNIEVNNPNHNYFANGILVHNMLMPT